ncbi:unnamed protein product [Psylliodes chrysocephalus]|uniref:HAT C-terminal dimerisation domain-containing protein n=1 Tax=Psylliodes chrysocephalus TaxID=3402493 RepID=A0A9P0D400_9CUCU|nr:unnamed protein product [Psylliodes chrysocephala]
MKSTTAEAITDTLFQELTNMGLSLEKLRGQGYDGTANMSGAFKGVQALIRKEQPLALYRYTHCFKHSLNLAVCKSCDLSAINISMGIVGSVSTFLSGSAKRVNMLNEIIDEQEAISETNRRKLKPLSLQQLENDKDTETSRNAMCYSSYIKRSDFLVSLWVNAYLFEYSVTLSTVLQSRNLDISAAMENVKTLISTFKDLRSKSEEIFNKIFYDLENFSERLGIEIKIPRLCGKQTQRSNVETSTMNEYFGRSIFIPFLDHLIEELQSRFCDRLAEVIPLEGLIAAKFSKYHVDEIVKAAMFYESDINVSENQLRAEIMMWHRRWKDETTIIRPCTAVEALMYCTDFFPLIRILLIIFATLPVTTATPERSFSTSKRLKTYLRSTMLQERFSGLALLNVHKEIDIDHDKIINKFVLMKPRRMQLKDWSATD